VVESCCYWCSLLLLYRKTKGLNYCNGLGLWCLTPIFINNISIILWQVYF
jgi:hypothetical protein